MFPPGIACVCHPGYITTQLFAARPSPQVSVDALVAMLREYKNSPDAHKQEVFACMIHNLFDEYR